MHLNLTWIGARQKQDVFRKLMSHQLDAIGMQEKKQNALLSMFQQRIDNANSSEKSEES